MKKILFSLCVLFLATFVLAGCDEIKQVVSDIAEEEIESQVNDMLGLTEEDELFQLPEAKRYEEFKFDVNDPEKTTFSLAVIEPKVTVEDYAKQMIETFAAGFEDEIDEEEILEAIEQIKEQKVWTYEFEGDVFTVNFEEFFAADGETIEKWTIAFEVVYGNVEAPEQSEVPQE